MHISIQGSTCLALQLTSSTRFRDEFEALEYAKTGLVLRVESKLTTMRTFRVLFHVFIGLYADSNGLQKPFAMTFGNSSSFSYDGLQAIFCMKHLISQLRSILMTFMFVVNARWLSFNCPSFDPNLELI